MAFDKLRQFGGQMSELKKMRDQAMQLQKALAQQTIVVKEGNIKIVMSGDQKVKELVVDGESQPRLAEVFNKATKKSQEVAAKKLQETTDLGSLSGLLKR